MKTTKWATAIAATLLLATPAEGVNWIFRSVGSDMAGGTFSVTFFGPPPGAAGAGPFVAPILAGPAGTGTATVTPSVAFPLNTVTLTVVGDKFTTTWHITNSIQTIAFVNIDLTGSPPAFDDGSFPSTPFSAAGRPYTFVPNADFPVDPVAAGGAVFGLPPFKSLGDMWKNLTLTFIAGAFTTAPGVPVTLDFMTDTDTQIFDSSFVTCDSAECEPNGACCGEDQCVEAIEQECIDSGLGAFRGTGTTCAGEACGSKGAVKTVSAASDWGLVLMALLLLTTGTIVLARRRGPAAT